MGFKDEIIEAKNRLEECEDELKRQPSYRRKRGAIVAEIEQLSNDIQKAEQHLRVFS